MKFSLKMCFKIGLTVFLTYLAISYCTALTNLLSLLYSAVSPLLVGCLIAFIVNIPMSFFERIYFPRKSSKVIVLSRRPVCLFLSVVSIIGVVYLLLSMVVPELVRCFVQLISLIPETYDRIINSNLVTEWIPQHIPYIVDNIDLASFDIQGLIEKSLKVLGDSIGGVFNFSFSLLVSAFSTLISTVVSIIFAIYILLGKAKLKVQIKRLMSVVLKPKIYAYTIHIAEVLNDSFRKFFVGQFTEAIILGVLCTLGMTIFKFPYATMIGVMIGFTALIPVAGAYIGAIFGAIMILTEESFVTALFFVLFIVVLQQLEGNIIYPRVVGNSVGLPALWVLFAVTVGGALGGIIGMLLAVPLVAACYRLVKEYVQDKELNNKKP